MAVADWFLYECVGCGQRTFLTPAGGNLNDCECPEPHDATITPLYAGGPLLGKRLSELGKPTSKPWRPAKGRDA